MKVDVCRRILAGHAGQQATEVGTLEGPQTTKIEHCAEVDREPFSPLSGEHAAAESVSVEVVHTLGRQSCIVRCRQRTDVAWWHNQIAREQCPLVAIRPDDAVGLT